MRRRTFAAALALSPLATRAQGAFPNRPIRLMVPFPPGSATDAMTRFLAERAAHTLGQPMVIENKAGAQGSLAASQVARATPDGYLLLVGTNSTQAANLHLMKSLPYDPRKDFAAVTQFTVNPLVMVVRADLPAQDLRQFIAYAKSRPDQLNYGVGNTGSLVTVQQLKNMTGIRALDVSYPGSPQAIAEVLGGRLDFMITDISVVKPHLESGKLRALGVTTGRRVAVLPEVPTMAEAGLPGYEFAAWGGLFAPAGTPPAIVGQLNAAFVAALKGDDAKAFFDKQGQIAAPTAPEAFSRYVDQEIVTWGKLLADSGKAPQ